MRFMVLLKADKNTEAGVLPDEKGLTEMGKYNEELVKAGIERRRITIMGMGKPISPDPTSATSKKSQRIEVSVIQ